LATPATGSRARDDRIHKKMMPWWAGQQAYIHMRAASRRTRKRIVEVAHEIIEKAGVKAI
jgi:hypothetical protein